MSKLIYNNGKKSKEITINIDGQQLKQTGEKVLLSAFHGLCGMIQGAKAGGQYGWNKATKK